MSQNIPGLKLVSVAEGPAFRLLDPEETYLKADRLFSTSVALEEVTVDDVAVASMDKEFREYLGANIESHVPSRDHRVYELERHCDDITKIYRHIPPVSGSLGHLWYYLSLNGFSRGKRGPLQMEHPNFYPLGGRMLVVTYVVSGWTFAYREIGATPPIDEWEGEGEEQRWSPGTRFVVPV